MIQSKAGISKLLELPYFIGMVRAPEQWDPTFIDSLLFFYCMYTSRVSGTDQSTPAVHCE